MRQSKYLSIILCVLVACAADDRGFFGEMPDTFATDSLTMQKDLFASLRIEHLNRNEIAIRPNDCTLIPFCGNLWFRNDTIYHRYKPSEKYEPYLILNGRRFDTLRYVYSHERIDDVVYMGLMWDQIKKDSIKYFQLIPVRRTSPFHSTYIKYIAIESGGILYLTFSGYTRSYTISIEEYPKVIWQSVE